MTVEEGWQEMTNQTPTIDERHAKLLRLAEEQGVKLIESIDELRGDFFPEDESIDDFVATVRRWRDEGDMRRRRVDDHLRSAECLMY